MAHLNELGFATISYAFVDFFGRAVSKADMVSS